ncbi:MAG: AsnC family transcriptional regulator [Hyperthermus sp.]|nr:MAG: AsnC family transcriptional regulator [Hyperthermus sp.]
MVDDVDVKLVKLLAQDSRLSIRMLARELGLAPSTIHSRLRKLMETGLIKRFTVAPDYEKLGFSLTALILLQVEGEKILDVGEYIARDPRVMQVYDITGDYDLAVVAKFRNIDELDSFIKTVNRMKFVKRSVTSLSLRTIKEDFISPLLRSDNA